MFPCNPRYIEVYISTKREMQRHLSLRKEMIRLRRELGSTAEERELDYTRGSSAEREKGESSPMVCVCVCSLRCLHFTIAVCCWEHDPAVYSFHVREVMIADVNDVSPPFHRSG